ncbi:MAG: sugar ABC transporter permease [Anaerolineae bacterium]|nr:sugar ABC transporter permease [Anaerolineae bacterium]
MQQAQQHNTGNPLTNFISAWKRHNRQGDLTAAIIALAPAVLVFGIFNIYPLLNTAFLSLFKWDGLSAEKLFVGLDNFRNLLTSDVLWNSLRATTGYTIGVTIVCVPLALIVAVLLNTGVRFQSLYRTMYFLPVVTATVAVAVVWRYMLDPGSGYLNVFLRQIGIVAPSWLRSTTWAMPAVIMVGVWKRLGFNLVVYLAALQSIPREYYEAAQVDGAGRWDLFRRITVPLITPTTALLTVLSIIDGFLLFDQVYVMTNGGPAGATDVVGLLLYRQAFRYFDLGSASATAVIVFVIVAALTLLQWRVSRFGAKDVS